MGEVAASDPGGFPLGADGLHHQLHNLVQVLPIGGKLPAQVVSKQPLFCCPKTPGERILP